MLLTLTLTALTADINNRADAKIAEAQKKQEEYNVEKGALEDAAKAAVEASATLKEHAAVKKTLIEEKQSLAERVEKTETQLVQVCPPPPRLTATVEPKIEGCLFKFLGVCVGGGVCGGGYRAGTGMPHSTASLSQSKARISYLPVSQEEHSSWLQEAQFSDCFCHM